jgi:hypothetical protein
VPGVICRPQFVVGTVGLAVGLWGGPPRPAPFAALRASSEHSARVGATSKMEQYPEVMSVFCRKCRRGNAILEGLRHPVVCRRHTNICEGMPVLLFYRSR